MQNLERLTLAEMEEFLQGSRKLTLSVKHFVRAVELAERLAHRLAARDVAGDRSQRLTTAGPSPAKGAGGHQKPARASAPLPSLGAADLPREVLHHSQPVAPDI